jgi:DNA-binding CsgD family transcriptional regulator
MYVHVAGCSLVTGLLLQGRVDDAAQALALGAERPASGFFAAWLHTAEGRVAAARGDHAAAHDHFLATGRCLRELMMVNPTVLPWRSEAALAAQRLGDEEEARALVAEELELAEAFGAPRAIGVAGRAAGLLERGERAVDLQRSAMEILASSGARVEHAAALVELGAAIRRAGRPREARDVLRETQALAESVAASALAERARGELRLAGGRGRASEAAPGGLTPSERRVADLAADGQTNREIATALFITVKAVEWHLGNAYRKLEIGGRRELAEALGEAPPAAP